MRRINRLKLISLFLLFFIVISLVFLSVLSLRTSKPKYVKSAILNIPSSICSVKCLGFKSLAPFVIGGIKLFFPFFLFFSLFLSISKTIKKILKTKSFLKEIRKSAVNSRKYGVEFKIFDSKLPLAFTAGFLKPEIYISSNLMNSLMEQDIKTIIFHEAYHKKNRDPLKSILLSFLFNFIFFIPISNFLKKIYELSNEIIADMNSIEKGARPQEMASLLLKILSMNNLQSSWFSNASYERIRFLLEEKTSIFPPLCKTFISLALIIFGFLFVSNTPTPRSYEYFLDHHKNCPISFLLNMRR